MTQKDNILQELKELKSTLPLNQQNPYTVPAGYFEVLAARMLSRIKAKDINAGEEMNALSPLLSAISKEMPYSVPSGYFDEFTEKAIQLIRESSDYQSATEELETLSPLLSGLKKQVPYAVPAGYFENLAAQVNTEENKPTKVIAITRRKWFRYAAAAMVTGVIVMAGFLFFGNGNHKAQTGSKVMAKFTREVKKMNETQKDDLIDFIDAGMSGDETTQVSPKLPASEEVKNLLKDVSDEELKDFQEQTEDVQDVLMTN